MIIIPDELKNCISIVDNRLRIGKPKTEQQRLAVGRIFGSGACFDVECKDGSFCPLEDLSSRRGAAAPKISARTLRTHRAEAERHDRAENERWDREFAEAHRLLMESFGAGRVPRQLPPVAEKLLPPLTNSTSPVITGKDYASIDLLDVASFITDWANYLDEHDEDSPNDWRSILVEVLNKEPRLRVADASYAIEEAKRRLVALTGLLNAALTELHGHKRDRHVWFCGGLGAAVLARDQAGWNYGGREQRNACIDRGDFGVFERRERWLEAFDCLREAFPDAEDRPDLGVGDPLNWWPSGKYELERVLQIVADATAAAARCDEDSLEELEHGEMDEPPPRSLGAAAPGGDRARVAAAATPAVTGNFRINRDELAALLLERVDLAGDDVPLDGLGLLVAVLDDEPRAKICDLVYVIELAKHRFDAIVRSFGDALLDLRRYPPHQFAWFSGDLAARVKSANAEEEEDDYAMCDHRRRRNECLDAGDFDVVRRRLRWVRASDRLYRAFGNGPEPWPNFTLPIRGTIDEWWPPNSKELSAALRVVDDVTRGKRVVMDDGEIVFLEDEAYDNSSVGPAPKRRQGIP